METIKLESRTKSLKAIIVKSILFGIFNFLFCFSLYSQPKKLPATKKTTSPSVSPTEKPTTRILFVFDASYSMFGQWQSGMKMDIAKRLLSEFLDSFKSYDHLEIAFRAYGHQHSLRPQRDCKDTKLEVPFSTDLRGNVSTIKRKLADIVPRGTTPIAYTLEQCGDDFPAAGSSTIRNIIILITDGIEECDGDPCAVSLMLQKKGIILKPFVIGIGLDESFKNAFGCVGKYYDASNEESFKNILNVVISQALNNTTAQVNLLDQIGKPTETDVNMTFYDETSGVIKYDFMHTLTNRGLPDTLILDPIGTYHLVVYTIPPVEKHDITLVAGKHNIIPLDAPQGYLNLKVAYNNYKVLKCIVRKNGDMKTLHVQDFTQTEKYIVGKYDLEILSLPRIRLDNVDIAQSKTTTIEIPQAGMAVINKPNEGPGSLYLEEKNKLTWVCNLQDNIIQENIVLQPGSYRVEWRSKNAKESIYTVERRFKVESGSTVSVKVY
ncbi:MAG: VWA domain-containing protein [Bacteroidia bacterium]|nr:VWA domain-containing protein [Bacteroidia bacterium]